MFFKSTKRGISPLIATVLLIAFAVSLGAVVINLGASVFNNPCKERTVEILTVNENVRICHLVSAKTLSMTVVNTGKSSLNGFRISVVGDTAYNEDIAELFEPLEKKVISYPVKDITTIDFVSIIPYYEKNGKIEYCSENEVDYTQIPRC